MSYCVIHKAGYTALMRVARAGAWDMTLVLLDAGVTITDPGIE